MWDQESDCVLPSQYPKKHLNTVFFDLQVILFSFLKD